jgi:hypothetical protein
MRPLPDPSRVEREPVVLKLQYPHREAKLEAQALAEWSS